MLETLKEVYEEGLPEEEDGEEVVEEAVPYKRFGYSKALPIHQDEFDVLNIVNSNERIRKFKFENKSGLLIEVMDYGATILSMRMPDKYGNLDDILLGFDTVQEYHKKNCNKFGAMIGRTSDIIEDAYFNIDTDLHFLRKNADAHQRDGGVVSFDKVLWKSYVDKVRNTLILTYLSEHGEEGYPGNLLTKIYMNLSDENEFIITIDGQCDEITPVDISPRLFFNLAGHGAGEDKIMDHRVLINADMYVMQDRQGVPTGRLKHVNRTYFDLRTPKPFHSALDRIRGGGYNHTFCLNNAHRDGMGMLFAARLEECSYGRYVEIWTDAPGLFFSTANNFPECHSTKDDDVYAEEGSTTSHPQPLNSKSGVKSKSGSLTGRLFGKGGMLYFQHGAVALAPQGYPNSVNMPTFPSCFVKPQKGFQRKIIYKFGVSPKILARPKTKREESSQKSTEHAMEKEKEKL